MTTEHIPELAHQISVLRWTSDWNFYVLLGLINLIAAAIGAAIGSYFTKRGEILAIKDQIDEVVRQSSRINKAVEHEKSLAWVEQKRWDLKREIYVRLMENLDDLMIVYTEMVYRLRSNVQISEEMRQIQTAATKNVLRTMTIGKLFLSKESQSVFFKLLEGTRKAQFLSNDIGKSPENIPFTDRVPVVEALRTSVGEMIDLVATSAKHDLILSNSSGQTSITTDIATSQVMK